VADNVEAYGNINYAYRSSTYGTLDVRVRTHSGLQPDQSVGRRQDQAWRAKWDVSLWAKNVFDKQYYTSLWNTSAGAYNA
jgi:iron complex outermembrane receptor protein